jgi:hypothetical protein
MQSGTCPSLLATSPRQGPGNEPLRAQAPRGRWGPRTYADARRSNARPTRAGYLAGAECQRNEKIHALTSQRAQEPLAEGIRPRAVRWGFQHREASVT